MWKKLTAAALLLCLCVSLLTACGEKKEEITYETFSKYTDLEIFQDVPAINMEKARLKDASHYGDENYVISLGGIFLEDYTAYLKTLESAGYTKLLDNGDGVGGATLAAYYQKDGLTLNVAYNSSTLCAYISASKNAQISPHLTYDASFVAGNIDGAQTILEMHQVPDYGNCFIIQLKNGHFIVNDGGWKSGLKILLQHLIENTPEGQKTVVEAWFVSHEHADHIGCLKDASTCFEVGDVSVEGFYLSQVKDEIGPITNATEEIGTVYLYRSYFKNSEGDAPPIYRTHLGDKYYFSDIVVEVPYTQEQFPYAEYIDNLNVSSTWLMYNIEGQKFLLSGDTEIENMRDVSEMYDESYMDVDIMSLHHHSLNVYTDNLDYFKVETMLYSTWGTYSIYWPEQTRLDNLSIQNNYCDEYVSYMAGGVRLTFPYTVGSYEILDPWYPDFSEYCINRQEEWLKAAGLL